MTDSQEVSSSNDDIPEPDRVRRRRWTVSLIWLVPLVAALVGVSMMINSWISAGPQIDISFEDAQGITAGKTEVKYKNVVIGKVSSMALSDDRDRVLVKVDLDKRAESFATAKSRFWVVRPRVGMGGVSGLGTLLSGSYIGADTGGSDKRKTHFKGLETPPPLTHNEEGSTFLLSSDDLGSLDIGSPVYYRRIQVGRVVAYHLDDDGKGVTVQVFVESPDDKYVTTDSRFWNASGVDVSLGASGLKVNTESLATLVAGGLAFQAPPYSKKHDPADAGTKFDLFDTKSAAMKPADGPPLMLKMRFRQSVRGLAVGAPLDFLGIELGKVTAISLDFDPKTKRFPADVTAVVYPQRIGKANKRFIERTGNDDPGALMAVLVKHGLRAQLRNGNLLTGQLYVALDFFPKASKADFDPDAKPLDLPTMAGSFDKLQQQVADIVEKVHKIPFDDIGNNLNDSLKHLDGVLAQFNDELAPEAKATLQQAQKTLDSAGDMLSNGSPLQHNLGQTLIQLQRAARSLRVLGDYLSRHPEALLRGRQNNADPVKPATPPANPPSAGSQP